MIVQFLDKSSVKITYYKTIHFFFFYVPYGHLKFQIFTVKTTFIK